MIKNIANLVLELINPKKDWKFFLLDNWNSVVGDLSSRIRLEKIVDDIIFIGVYEAHWMHELFILSKYIIKNINNALQDEKIKSIKFKLVEIPETKNKILNKSLKLNVKKNNLSLTQKQKNALSKIKDEELSKDIVDFYFSCSNL